MREVTSHSTCLERATLCEGENYILNNMSTKLEGAGKKLKEKLEAAEQTLQDALSGGKSDLEVAKAELQVAKAELQVAKAELQVAKSEGKSDLEVAKAELQVAEQKLQVAEQKLQVAKAELQVAETRLKEANTESEKKTGQFLFDQALENVKAATAGVARTEGYATQCQEALFMEKGGPAATVISAQTDTKHHLFFKPIGSSTSSQNPVCLLRMQKAPKMASNSDAFTETGHLPALGREWLESKIPRKKMKSGSSSGKVIHHRDGPLEYTGEADVACFVKEIQENVASVCNIGLSFFAEMAMRGLRPDISAVCAETADGRVAVGFTEVKKPGTKRPGYRSPLLVPEVLGELYDYMVQLPSLYGVWPAYGILTSYNEWLFCKLPDEIRPVGGESVRRDDAFETPLKGTSVKATTPPKSPAPLTTSTVTDGEVDSIETDDLGDAPRRDMLVSKLFCVDNDGEAILEHLNGVLHAMRDCQIVTLPAHKRARLKVIRKGVSAEEFRAPPVYDRDTPPYKSQLPPANCKTLWLLDELGHRFRPRVFRAASIGWRLCVVKFVDTSRQDPVGEMEKCSEYWKRVYGDKYGVVRCEKWAGSTCFIMPDLQMMSGEDVTRLGIQRVCNMVKATLSVFSENGLLHPDVCMRNIALVGNDAVLVDLDDVKRHEKEDWVDSAIQKLRNELEALSEPSEMSKEIPFAGLSVC